MSSILNVIMGEAPVDHKSDHLTNFEKIYFKLAQHLSVNLFEKYCKGIVEGIDHIANLKSGFIIASNHVSYLDWLVLYSVFKNRYGKEIIFLAKDKLFNSVIWKKLIKATKCIKVTDKGISISSMRRIYRTVKGGGIVGVFPEGTRSPTGELLPAKEGFAKIAALTRAPIVPVGLIGFYEVWPRHKLLPSHFGNCKIKIGKPIFPDEIIGDNGGAKPDYDRIANIAMQNIAELIGKKYSAG